MVMDNTEIRLIVFFAAKDGEEWVNLIQMTIISTTGGKNPLEDIQ